MKMLHPPSSTDNFGRKPAQEQRLIRFQREYSSYAKEAVSVEEIKGAYYAFGSELAVLRLYHKMRGHGRAGYSVNMGCWFYTPNG